MFFALEIAERRSVSKGAAERFGVTESIERAFSTLFPAMVLARGAFCAVPA